MFTFQEIIRIKLQYNFFIPKFSDSKKYWNLDNQRYAWGGVGLKVRLLNHHNLYLTLYLHWKLNLHCQLKRLWKTYYDKTYIKTFWGRIFKSLKLIFILESSHQYWRSEIIKIRYTSYFENLKYINFWKYHKPELKLKAFTPLPCLLTIILWITFLKLI